MHNLTQKHFILYRNALANIAKIELREFPDSSPWSLESASLSDRRMLETFCKGRRIFDRSSHDIRRRQRALSLMAAPHFLYYLPATLLTCLQYPANFSLNVIGNMGLDVTFNETVFQGNAGVNSQMLTSVEFQALKSVRDFCLADPVVRRRLRLPPG